jgi:pimeloyl-ACP methyl ester carboxylesterase
MSNQLTNTQENKRPTKKGGCWWWGVRIAGGLLLLLVVLTACTWVFGRSAKSALAADYPPPGRMVDVGGFKMHIDCQGAETAGQPTVILDAGAGDYSLVWNDLQSEVARFARVCAYDRAGLGWSEPSPNDRTSDHIAEELHTLLNEYGLAGPYVLVGHSAGGTHIRYFAHLYPEEVVGMVLVDAEHEDAESRWPASFLQAKEDYDRLGTQMLAIPQMLNAIGFLALRPDSYPDQFLTPVPAEMKQTQKVVLAINGDHISTAVNEMTSDAESKAMMQAIPSKSLGDMPLVVLTAGRYEAPFSLPPEDEAELLAAQAELQEELAKLSSNGQQIIAEQSAHYIHIDEPDLVAEAIRAVVEQAGGE